MKPSEALNDHQEAIRLVVESHNAKNPRIFGLVIYGEDTEDSDLDLLVDTTPDTSIFDVAKIKSKLQFKTQIVLGQLFSVKGNGLVFSLLSPKFLRRNKGYVNPQSQLVLLGVILSSSDRLLIFVTFVKPSHPAY